MKRTGVDVHRFDVLPMLGVRGTKSQVERLLGLSAPLSIYADRELDFLLHESVRTIGVDRVRSGLGYDGSGENSGGYYTGVAPGSDLVGIGTGDTLLILYALEGFDYALQNQRKYDIRVISNSCGTSGKFERDDPINRASKLAHDRGMTITFAAGNEGPGRNTLNPYSVAPWVIGVAAGRKDGKTLASFSSRGVQGDNLYHPDITAPGVNIVSARTSTGATINGLAAAGDATYIPRKAWPPYYTTASGTSMATPHVSGTVALMEKANPVLGPDAIERPITSTATPMQGYADFEVGAGYLDAYEAVSRARALR